MTSSLECIAHAFGPGSCRRRSPCSFCLDEVGYVDEPVGTEFHGRGRRLVAIDVGHAARRHQARGVDGAMILVRVLGAMGVDVGRPQLADGGLDGRDRLRRRRRCGCRWRLPNLELGAKQSAAARFASAVRALASPPAAPRLTASGCAAGRPRHDVWPCAPPQPISTSSGCAPIASTRFCWRWRRVLTPRWPAAAPAP